MTDVEAEFVHIAGLRAYLARPRGGATGGMLLLPMITGIDAQVREYAQDIAGTGVTALVWDPWHGPSADDTAREELMEMMGRLDDEKCLAEMAALLDHAFGELGLVKVGVIGWCLGGRLALLLGARDPRMANVVAYHPSIFVPTPPNHTLDAVEQAGRVAAPVMVLHAGADTIMSTETFGRLQSTLQQRGTGATITHVYPGAEHGFSSRGRHDNPVNAEAYAVSWPQALDFIGDTVRS
ncbi:dienelactone hydrolase family protein [Rhodococcus sp. CH91]|uniref:dienelactone hydrolase family protein n=1 Tax=Rhodococcus sp. CH91 TaxID=2910256 RepID=UPI001F4A60FA|nr:dienelactone hydrolase family protein [Rhodococcus sp. CH91]